MQISVFAEKLNKVTGNIYVIEEEVQLTDGVYEAELRHDNINEATLAVYTGPKLTGERIQSFVLSTPSLTPWKKIIRAYADVPVLYISYETDGDTVEADDINKVQQAITETQMALNEEADRAGKAEEVLASDLESETSRAKGAEKVLTDDLADEVKRAAGKEEELAADIQTEADRAKQAETVLTRNLDSEIGRAKSAEKTNADNLSAESARAEAAEESIRSTINTNKPVWDDKYTRNEVDNKFSSLETAIDWKEAVGTYADIVKTYPDPDDGWTVNVKDTDYTYRWSGTKWVAISANAIPKATQEVDGLLSKEDKADYDDVFSKRHIHSNKSVIDKITQALLDNWNAAYTHISDAVKHITAAERTAWNDADSKKHTHSNKSVIDKLTQSMLDKLTGIAAGANNYIHPATHPANMITEDYTHRFMTDICKTIADWNVAVTNGFYMALRGENAPSTGWYFGRVLVHNENYVYQEVYAFAVSTDAKAVPKYIRCKMNGTWGAWTNVTVAKAVPADAKFTDTIYTHSTASGNKHIPSGGATGQFLKWSADGTAVWSADNNTTYSAFKAATASVAGGTGLVPAPAAGAQGRYLRADGTWQTLPSTSYTHPNSGVSAGTYRSVTVDAQGHVKAGTNPTTLAGYGITDAAAKTHSHDGTYLKKGVTWNDLKGV